MALQFVCECGKKISVHEELVGKRVRCPACQRVISVPEDAGGEREGGGEAELEPRRKRSRGERKKRSSTMMYLGIGAGVMVLGCCCLGVGAGAFFYFLIPGDKVLAGTLPIEEKGRWTSFDRTTVVTEAFGISVNAPYKAYKVPLKANTTYEIDLIQVGPSTDPYLILEDPDGKRVASNDDYAPPSLNAKIVYTPTRAGDYRILAATIAELGDFTLKIRELKGSKGPGDVGKGGGLAIQGPIKSLTVPATELGAWTAQDPIHPFWRSPYKTYKVNFQAGKSYKIDLVSNMQGQDPFLYLTDAAGAVLAQDDDSGGFPNARIVFVAARTGEHRIIATTINNTMGNFTLTIREGTK
jgi:hypothetical protein